MAYRPIRGHWIRDLYRIHGQWGLELPGAFIPGTSYLKRVERKLSGGTKRLKKRLIMHWGKLNMNCWISAIITNKCSYVLWGRNIPPYSDSTPLDSRIIKLPVGFFSHWTYCDSFFCKLLLQMNTQRYTFVILFLT